VAQADQATRADAAETATPPRWALNRIRFLCHLPDEFACGIDWD
jgi:hypothetical protein